MYKMLKKILAAFMVTVMLFTAIPAAGIRARRRHRARRLQSTRFQTLHRGWSSRSRR